MDHRFLQWLAGQVDGDGAIGVRKYAKSPFISIKKAEKGKHAIEMVHSRLGGEFRLNRKQTGRVQAAYQWELRGAAVVAVVKQIIPFLQQKRSRAEAIAQWRSQFGMYTVTDAAGATQTGLKEKDVVRIVGRSPPTIAKYRKSGRRCNGFVIARETGTGAQVHERVQELKHKLDTPAPYLHPSYIAGFFDAEGCIRTQGPALRVTVTQDDPAILYVIQNQYGGSVLHDKKRKSNALTFCATNARVFLMALRRDVYEKADQLELALRFNKDNWQELGPRMKALRGNQL